MLGATNCRRLSHFLQILGANKSPQNFTNPLTNPLCAGEGVHERLSASRPRQHRVRAPQGRRHLWIRSDTVTQKKIPYIPYSTHK